MTCPSMSVVMSAKRQVPDQHGAVVHGHLAIQPMEQVHAHAPGMRRHRQPSCGRHGHASSLMRPSCSHPAAILQPSCSHLAAIMWPSCGHHAAIMWPSCGHDAAMMWPSCSHHAAMIRQGIIHEAAIHAPNSINSANVVAASTALATVLGKRMHGMGSFWHAWPA